MAKGRRAAVTMHLGITSRFVTAVVTAAVAPLLVYGLVSIYSLRTGNQRSVTEGNLNVAEGAAYQIDQYMGTSVEVLQSVAAELRNTDLRVWQQDRILKNHVLDFPKFRELTLFSPEGGVVATSRVAATRLTVPAESEGYEPHVAPITVDDDFLPTTTITIPLVRLGRPDGWLVGEVNLKSSGGWWTRSELAPWGLRCWSHATDVWWLTVTPTRRRGSRWERIWPRTNSWRRCRATRSP